MNKDHASLRVGLSSTSVTVLRTSGWLRRHREVVADYPIDASSTTQLRADLERSLSAARCTGLPTVVVLADGWTRLFLVAPPLHTTCLEDCKAAATRRFQLLYGDTPAQWLIDADWDANQPFLACAIPRAIPTTLQQVANAHGLKVIGIAPQFIVGWNQWRTTQKSDIWFGTLHLNDLTLGAVHQGRLVAVRHLQLTPAELNDPRCFMDQIKREALRLSLSAPISVQLCGHLPQPWQNRNPGDIAIMTPKFAMPAVWAGASSPGADLAITGVAP